MTTGEQQDRTHFTVTMLDRDITFKAPTDGQIAQMLRYVNAAQRAKSTADSVNAIARMLDVLMAIIESDEDRNWVDDGLVSGDLELKDMMEPMEAFVAEQQEEAPKNGPKTATRGRR